MELVRYDAMCRAIDAAYEVDEVKDIRDKAKALEEYAKQAHNVEAERRACEIRLRAERKAGQLTKEVEKRPGTRTDRPPVTITGGSTKSKVLRDAGVTEMQARQWEKLADVPDDEFEAMLGDTTAKPTTNGIIRAAAAPKVTPVSDEALWLWGRLRDFEKDILGMSPADVMSTMVPHMRDTVHELAPRVAKWLRRIGECDVRD